MQINFNANIDPVPRAGAKPAKSSESSPAPEAAAFDGARALDRSLSETPDVRADKVAAGRKLVEDTHYPPQETIKRIARLLAISIGNESP